ncbi:MAG: hypothetical protein BWY85_02284 [Firmicutes bacterium ADurb.Bin506]|nr:MAG: hypothetical protein BWY85_02284 [Firmicutes bacterium ADurb.Bin506]
MHCHGVTGKEYVDIARIYQLRQVLPGAGMYDRGPCHHQDLSAFGLDLAHLVSDSLHEQALLPFARHVATHERESLGFLFLLGCLGDSQPGATDDDGVSHLYVGYRSTPGTLRCQIHNNRAVHLHGVDLDPGSANVHKCVNVRATVEVFRAHAVLLDLGQPDLFRTHAHCPERHGLPDDPIKFLAAVGAHYQTGPRYVIPVLADLRVSDFELPAEIGDHVNNAREQLGVDEMSCEFDFGTVHR